MKRYKRPIGVKHRRRTGAGPSQQPWRLANLPSALVSPMTAGPGFDSPLVSGARLSLVQGQSVVGERYYHLFWTCVYGTH